MTHGEMGLGWPELSKRQGPEANVWRALFQLYDQADFWGLPDNIVGCGKVLPQVPFGHLWPVKGI